VALEHKCFNGLYCGESPSSGFRGS
jgi:hypothetical protein